jgi:hypothetical protein
MFKRIVIAAVIAAALALPASASANTTFLPPFESAPRTTHIVTTSAAVPAVPGESSGFAWGDAGVGAAAALLLVGTTGLLVLVSRRRRGTTGSLT